MAQFEVRGTLRGKGIDRYKSIRFIEIVEAADRVEAIEIAKVQAASHGFFASSQVSHIESCRQKTK